jgi:hypothetical protein
MPLQLETALLRLRLWTEPDIAAQHTLITERVRGMLGSGSWAATLEGGRS